MYIVYRDQRSKPVTEKIVDLTPGNLRGTYLTYLNPPLMVQPQPPRAFLPTKIHLSPEK